MLGKLPAEILRQLWQRWLTHAVIDEFSRIEQIKGQRIRSVLTAAKPRRQIVAVHPTGAREDFRDNRATCYPISDRYLAVPPDQELKFRKALLELGYALSGQPTT